MNVLSLFDGMSCGMLAMLGAGVNVDRYVAYEIDKYAVQTSIYNFPFIEQMGDVFEADFTQYEGFDFLVGGSPCTYWSIAQTKNRETVASGMGWDLFCQYTRALHEAKPKFFIYENNKSMSQAIRDSIDEAFGFEAIHINSALLSAQNRNRLYWVGIRNDDGTYSKANIQQPEDKHIHIQSILETGAESWLKKSYTIDATYYKGGVEIPSTDINQEQEFKWQNQLMESVGSQAVNTTEIGGGRQESDIESSVHEEQCDEFRGIHQHIRSYRSSNEIGWKPLSDKEVDYMVRDHQDMRWSHLNKPYEEEKSKCVVANFCKGVPYNVVAERIGDNE